MPLRLLVFIILCINTSLLFAVEPGFQFMPSADDPAELARSNYPVNLGFAATDRPECKRSAKPGEPEYCLRPAPGAEIWLRADDTWARVKRVKEWRSPNPPSNPAFANYKKLAQQPTRLNDQIGNNPALHIADYNSMKLKWAQGYEQFTLFVVGRQVPGTKTGPILSSSQDGLQWLAWTDNTSVLLKGDNGQAALFKYDEVNQYHILTLHYDGAEVTAFVNGVAIGSEAFTVSPTVKFTYVGVAPNSTKARRIISAFRNIKNTKGTDASDIAEIIAYPEALSIEDMRMTMRYLQKKYSEI